MDRHKKYVSPSRVVWSKLLGILLAVCVVGTSLNGCDSESPQLPESGAELQLSPGNSVTGVDGFTVTAPQGALEAPIWVTISRVERPEASPLTEELEHAGATYRVSARQGIALGDVPLVFELPRVDDTEEAQLAATFFEPASWRAWDPSDGGPEHDLWVPLDGRITEDGQRYATEVWTIHPEGVTVSMAHGRYFTHWEPEELDALDETNEQDFETQRSNLSHHDFKILCQGDADAFCNDVAANFRNQFLDAYRDFLDHGYPLPRLRTRSFKNNHVFKVYLKRVNVGDGDKLCDYSVRDGKWGGSKGRYHSFWKKLTVCIFDTPRRGIYMGSTLISAGDTLLIRGDDNEYEHQLGANENAFDAFRALEGPIDADPDLNAYIVDDFFVVEPLNHDSMEVLEAELNGSSFNGWRRVDHSSIFTARHEYYHALQYQFDDFKSNKSSRERSVVEGTAVAAERSLAQMDRDPTRNTLRAIDVGLFRGKGDADTHDYRAQDFFVYLGRRVGEGISYLIPFLSRGGLPSDMDAFLRNDYSAPNMDLSTAYWDWARNQAIEKSVDLGHWAFSATNQCDFRAGGYPALVGRWQQIRATESGTVSEISTDVDGTTFVEVGSKTYELPYPLQPVGTLAVRDTLSEGDSISIGARVPTHLVHRRPNDGLDISENFSLNSLTSRTAEFVLGPYTDDRSVEFSVTTGNPAVKTGFYDAENTGTPDCHGTTSSSNHLTHIPAGQTKTIWVLMANTATTGGAADVTLSSEFIPVEAPEFTITVPKTGRTYLETDPVFINANVNVPGDSGTVRWFLGGTEISQTAISANETLILENIGQACPQASNVTLRGVLEDDRGFQTDDDVDISVAARDDAERLQIAAGIGAGSKQDVRGSTLYVPVRSDASGVTIPDVNLEAVFDNRSCSALAQPTPQRYEWRRGGTRVARGADLLVDAAAYQNWGAPNGRMTLQLDHINRSSISSALTLVPCDPQAVQGSPIPSQIGYPACPGEREKFAFDGVNDLLEEYYGDRDEFDRIELEIILGEKMREIFGNSPPEPFPENGLGPAESMTDTQLGRKLYDLGLITRNAETPSGLLDSVFALDVDATQTLGPAELDVYLEVSTRVRAHLELFSPVSTGGLDAWWMLDTYATADAVGDAALTGLAQASFDGFMTGFAVDNPQYTATEPALDRGRQASDLSTVGYAADQLEP